MNGLYTETFGSGKPLVMVHGWAMHTGVWREFAQQLGAFYRVHCIDLPGHGRSQAIPSFTLHDIGTEVMRHAPLESCCWLGWSLGAIVVLDIARRSPEKVNSMILLGGNPRFCATADWPGMDAKLLRIFAENLQINSSDVLMRFLSLQVNKVTNAKVILKQLKAALLECALPDPKSLSGGLELLQTVDLREVYKQLQIPVQIIMGGEDRLVPSATGLAMQTLRPETELLCIEEAGHIAFLTHQLEVINGIRCFLQKNAI